MTHVVLDLETTSPDPNTARIVSMAFVTLEGETILHSLVNPLVTIPESATRIHGITDHDILDAKTFFDQADEVQAIVTGSILCGYHSRKFDVPVLDRELRNAGRAGIDLSTVREIDAHQVWIALEPRTLAGAFKQFCTSSLDDAHDALADARATAEVINAFRRGHHYNDEAGSALAQPEFEARALLRMEKASVPSYEIDRAGRFKKCEETGRALLAFGKHRGEFAADNRQYLRWMLSSDFPQETKAHIERWLNQ